MDPQARRELWEAMAEQFLDTEMRHQIPSLAARCVRAGLTPRQARDIWRYEVAPAVALNLWSVAGEWAGWPRGWLVERIERTRRRSARPPGWMAALGYYLLAGMIEPVWRAVERCMVLWASLPAREAARLEVELTWLARVFFDMVPGAPPTKRSARALRRAYEVAFLPIFGPLVCRDKISGESPSACRARGDRVLTPS
jgi:hypothetical protein